MRRTSAFLIHDDLRPFWVFLQPLQDPRREQRTVPGTRFVDHEPLIFSIPHNHGTGIENIITFRFPN